MIRANNVIDCMNASGINLTRLFEIYSGPQLVLLTKFKMVMCPKSICYSNQQQSLFFNLRSLVDGPRVSIHTFMMSRRSSSQRTNTLEEEERGREVESVTASCANRRARAALLASLAFFT